MTQPAEPVAPSCCGTVRDLIVRHLRTGDTTTDAGTALLLALGYEPGEVEDLVHTAREAGE